MTQSHEQQLPQLRLMTLLGVALLAALAALAAWGSASAAGPEDNPGDHPQPNGAYLANQYHDAFQFVQQQTGEWSVIRIFIPGIAAGSETPVLQEGTSTGFVPPAASPDTPSPTPAAQPATPAEPAATPSPAPATVVASGAGNCPALIFNALGLAGCKISFCESGWNPNAIGSAGELGWFQISPRWHSDATLDPAGNVAAAVRISRNGTDWSAWSVRSVLTTGRCPNGVAYPA